ncbi:TolC family protein [Lacunimicrobium album]
MAKVSFTTIVLLIAASGCRTAGPSGQGSSVSVQSLPSPAQAAIADLAPSSAGIQLASSAQDAPTAAVSIPVTTLRPTHALSLQNTISTALAQNPNLVALRQTEHVGSAAYGVAQIYPFNPLIQVQATPYQDNSQSGPGTTYHYVLLMQRIQLAHQQQYREDAGAASLNGIRWNVHQAELQTLSTTLQFYFTLLYRRGLLEVAQASHANNQQLLEVLSKRFDAGDASAADVATVRIDTSATQQQLQLANANYLAGQRDLLRQLGLPTNLSCEFTGDLTALRWNLPTQNSGDDVTQTSEVSGMPLANPVSDEWVKSWAPSRPDVLNAHANIDLARANLSLASANRVPDVQLGPYYQRTADSTTFVGFRAEMNIPVIDSGKPMERQRSAEYRQQVTVWRQALLRAELEGQAAFERYALALQSIAIVSNDQSAELPAALQSLENQFRSGEVDVIRVIQARTSMLQNQRARLDLVNEIAQSAAQLVGSTGMPLELLVIE